VRVRFSALKKSGSIEALSCLAPATRQQAGFPL